MTIKIKTHNLTFIIAFILFFKTFCFTSQAANPDQNIINQQDWITRQQQNKIEEDRRLKEQEVIKNERLRRKKEAPKKDKEKAAVSEKSVECFPIKEIRLTGVTLITKKKQDKIFNPFIGKCFKHKTMSDLISALTNYYHSQGYTTSYPNIPKQNIQDGILEIEMLEGKIEKIVIGEDGLVNKMQELTAFGNIKGDVLQIDNINQGMYQINRLLSNSATMKIEPGNNIGEAAVLVENNKKFPARATVSYDNLGNDFTGIRRSNFSGSLDNLLFLNDNINLNYATNLNDNSQEKDIKSFTSGISIPFGYNTFSYDYSRSEFRGTNQGVNGPLRLSGYSNRNNFTIDRVLFYKGNLRISANTSLTTKSSASYLNQEKIDTSERKLTIGNLGFSISNYFNNGVNLYLKPSYSKGLKLLNAKQDDPNLTIDIPKAQFDYFKLYASLSKRFILPRIEAPILLSGEMDSQYSKQTLYGTEQFAVGGYYSVRGFRENYIVGDNGYYFRNKANVNVGSIILPLIKKENLGLLAYLNKFSLEPFYDYGHVRFRGSGEEGRLSGAGIKTIFGSKYFNASVTFSNALQKSKLINSDKHENKMIYFEVSAGCC